MRVEAPTQVSLANAEERDSADTRLPCEPTTAMLIPMACAINMEAAMGDKSLKAKQREQKQKDAAKAGSAAAAKSKRESYTRPQQPVAKGKK